MGDAEEKSLTFKIEQLRKKMTETAIQQGFSSPESIQISQELDHLLNLYQNQKKQK
ncbi:aspartyl-phosphate phosphatase Spo0E family protein [Halobacillus salinarum]|uniref:Aspartyl-phosphate phosphatase Spo0E family protein n=1 Tax=Halobacillus salinarum TaxID=2932257 RepID=A0ABY4EFI3_9BACI|nr:aspartyl-phosphate phosphatase Spo0E family protein [Halobacillus salinarum]UOQ43236.1 aspartyl-phosphate phosphatase Spo0E family protein [Halobacillus salinarum]